MKAKYAWAVCPRIQCERTTRIPRLYVTLRQGRIFLNAEHEFVSVESEAAQAGVTVAEIRKRRRQQTKERKIKRAELHKRYPKGQLHPYSFSAELRLVTNRSCGWEEPVPIKGITIGPTKGCRTFEEFLPITEIGTLSESSLHNAIEKAVEGRFPRVSCSLADEWLFEEIERQSWKGAGHVFEGRKHSSVAGIVVRAVYDIEKSMLRLHKSLSCKARADFFQSWQVWNHVADFCYRVGESNDASVIVGEINAKNHARRVWDFVSEQMATYAHEVSITEAESVSADDSLVIETMGSQINRLREQSGLTIEELAEEVHVSPRSVQRHIAGDVVPHGTTVAAYNRTFSKLLNRQVVINKVS